MAKKTTRTKAELKELRKTFKSLSKDKQEIALNLLDELEFMQQVLIALRSRVIEDGPVSNFKQGSQEFLRQHPGLTAYNSLIPKYSVLYKQVTELLPKEDNLKDKLMDFVE